MKICFLWYFDKAPLVFKNWHDGLKGAINEIGKTNDVEAYIGKLSPTDEYDFILFWDDSNSDFFKEVDNYKCKKGICLTTWPHNLDNLRKIDVVYCESTPIYEYLRSQGIRTIKAFGTDTEFFKPREGEDKTTEYFYPATFSPWKRQSAIANLGEKLLCIGTVQPDGKDELKACQDNKVQIQIGYYPARHIVDHYNRSKRVIIPAIHGSERTVLEAMSMGIKPEVETANERAYSYVKELEESNLKPREFILQNYSHVKYAKDLLRGME